MFLHTSLLPPPITLKFTLAGERERGKEDKGGRGAGKGSHILKGLQSSLRVASLLCLCPTTEDASILFIAVGVG